MNCPWLMSFPLRAAYQPFFLGKEALLFQRREKKPEETTGTVILDDDTSNNKKQAAFERPAKKHNFKN